MSGGVLVGMGGTGEGCFERFTALRERTPAAANEACAVAAAMLTSDRP
ncbi:hypothetical protein ACIQ7Q_31000 [Streptomyces sp. NPDC096176]